MTVEELFEEDKRVISITNTKGFEDKKVYLKAMESLYGKERCERDDD